MVLITPIPLRSHFGSSRSKPLRLGHIAAAILIDRSVPLEAGCPQNTFPICSCAADVGACCPAWTTIAGLVLRTMWATRQLGHETQVQGLWPVGPAVHPEQGQRAREEVPGEEGQRIGAITFFRLAVLAVSCQPLGPTTGAAVGWHHS